MPVKDKKMLNEERNAVNQTLKSIEDILEAASKTTEGELAVTRINEAIRNKEAQQQLEKNTTTSTNLPPIFFSETTKDSNITRDIAKKIKSDKELTDYLTRGERIVTEDKVQDIYTLVKNDNGTINPRLSDSFPNTERPVGYEQTMLFDSTEEKKVDDDEILAEISKAALQVAAEKNIDKDDDAFAHLSERILSNDIKAIRGETVSLDQLKLSLNNTIENETIAQNDEKLDVTDINLRLAFNMLDEDFEVPEDIKKLTNGDDEKKAVKKQKREQTDEQYDTEYVGYEYESHEQNGEVESILRKAIKGWRVKAILVFLFAVAILFLETATKASDLHPVFLKPGRYGMLYAAVDLQILLFIAIVMLDSIKKGIRDLISLTPTTDSLLFFSMLLPTIHTVYCILTDPTNPSLGLFNLASAAAAFFIAIARLLQSKRDLNCFEIISDDRPKYAAESLTGATKEADEFYRYLLEDSAIYTVRKTDFVSGFFKRITSRAKSDDLIIWQIVIIIIAAVAMFSVSYIKGVSTFISYKYTSALIATSLPLCAIFASLLPTVKANKIAKRTESALIGNSFTEEYDSAAVISFADTEVFPSSNIKVTSLKTYGEYRIDKVIQEVAQIFEKLGGPLADVLSKVMIDNDDFVSMRYRLLECAPDGIVVSSEGRDFYIGKRSFMRGYMFNIPTEHGDAEFEETNGSIMYIGINEDLVAKFNLKYRINSRFDALLKEMYKAGMCVGIKTLDPNISNELLAKNVRFKKCPIAILKADKPEDINGKAETISSAIVTNGSLGTFLRMFILSDKTRHSIKSNIVLNMASMILSISIASFLILTGSADYLNSVYALIFQLLWLLPVGVMTYLS